MKAWSSTRSHESTTRLRACHTWSLNNGSTFLKQFNMTAWRKTQEDIRLYSEEFVMRGKPIFEQDKCNAVWSSKLLIRRVCVVVTEFTANGTCRVPTVRAHVEYRYFIHLGIYRYVLNSIQIFSPSLLHEDSVLSVCFHYQVTPTVVLLRSMGKKRSANTKDSSKNFKAGENNDFIWVDPHRIRFQHSRIRPYFSSCGRALTDTLESIRRREITPDDLPPIQVRFLRCNITQTFGRILGFFPLIDCDVIQLLSMW